MRIIFDLDGTLANLEHRLHHIQQKPKNWDRFFTECDKDERIYSVCNVFDALVADRNSQVEIWSGRSSIALDQTVKWLEGNLRLHALKNHQTNEQLAQVRTTFQRNFIVHADSQSKGELDCKHVHLRMRQQGRYIADDELKQTWLLDAIHNRRWRPDIVFDDRDRVVNMWRRNGIQCLQVAPGDF